MPNRIQAEAALWEQVWAEYDARKQQAPVAAMAARAPTPRRAPRHWGRRLRGMAALCIVLSATAYAIAPMLAAARLGEALAAGDAGVLEQVVDWRQVHAEMAQDMAAATQGHGLGATAFLAGMAGDVAQGLASPAGLVALLRDRMPRQSAGQGMAMLGAMRPLDATRLQVSLHAPGDSRQALSVTLALRDPWQLRWQVVAMAVPPAVLPDLGG